MNQGLFRAFLRLARRWMPHALRQGLLKTWRSFQKPYVRYEGFRLPPPYLRYGEAEFRTDARFVASAREEVRRIQAVFPLNQTHSVLDVGCGTARFALGLQAELGGVREYVGLDVDPRPIAWNQAQLSAVYPFARFVHVPLQHVRYHPDGTPLKADFRFEIASASVDVVYVYSVFCHLVTDELRAYFAEFARVLQPDGVLFCTAYLEDNVPPETINPENYIQTWTYPRHCVRFGRQHVVQLLREAGFRTIQVADAREYDGERAVFAWK